MLKKILEKSAFDVLHEELQKLYKLAEDGKYRLQLEDDDAEPLRRAKDHETGLRKVAEKERDEARAELTTAQAKVTELEKAQSQDSQSLRADHERVVADLSEKHKKEKATLEATIKKIYVGDVAERIAKAIAVDDGAAELLGEVIKRRLSVEMVNGEPVTRVLATDGTASVMSPDELQNEFFTNERYSGIMRASDASGGGASGSGKGGGAAGKKLDDLTGAERTKIQTENPVEWQRLLREKQAEIDSR